MIIVTSIGVTFCCKEHNEQHHTFLNVKAVSVPTRAIFSNTSTDIMQCKQVQLKYIATGYCWLIFLQDRALASLCCREIQCNRTGCKAHKFYVLWMSMTVTDLSSAHAATLSPVQFQLTSNMPPVFSNVLISFISRTDQIRSLLSNEPDASSFPSGLNAKLYTGCVWAWRIPRHSPFSAFHNLHDARSTVIVLLWMISRTDSRQ